MHSVCFHGDEAVISCHPVCERGGCLVVSTPTWYPVRSLILRPAMLYFRCKSLPLNMCGVVAQWLELNVASKLKKDMYIRTRTRSLQKI